MITLVISPSRSTPRIGRLRLTVTHSGTKFGYSGFAEGQRELLLGLAVTVVGADDALHELVADDVDVFEVAEANAFYAVEDVEGFEEAGFFRVGQVGLG